MEKEILKKAKRFDEALAMAKECITYVPDEAVNKYMLNIFPELKESEDEKISRKLLALVEWSKSYGASGITTDEAKEMIAWLEKQSNTNEIVNKKKIAPDILRGAAMNLITWIDYNISEGNMCLSYIERKRIEDALVDGDWGKIYAYMKKKLEKQGEHANFRSKIQIGDKVTRNDSGVLVNLSQFERVAKETEKQDEQKLTDKVEPKFKVGDWIVDKDDHEIFMVNKVLSHTYELISNDDNEDYHIPFYIVDRNYRLWTINDAIDGDVLACKKEILLFKSYSVQGRISLYCWYSGQTNNFHSKEVKDMLLTTRNKIYPATKSQRDLLFQKMHEAGYWDVEKKELKTYASETMNEKDAIDNGFTEMMLKEQKPIEWSEEDEYCRHQLIVFCENCMQPDSGAIRCANWLKSLRPQNRWKPSEEMLEALYRVIPNNVMEKSEDEMLLDKLYQGLKYGKVLSEN